mgnify:CR=1 FL=1
MIDREVLDLVTGPVTRNRAEALRHTCDATPALKLVVAVGDCDGGIFGASCAVCGRVADVAVPGCPPPLEKQLCGILTAVRCCRAPSAQGVTA